jgi:hypothetical protein
VSNAKQRELYLSFDNFSKKPILKKDVGDEWEFRIVTKNEDLNKTCFIYNPSDQKMIDVP